MSSRWFLLIVLKHLIKTISAVCWGQIMVINHNNSSNLTKICSNWPGGGGGGSRHGKWSRIILHDWHGVVIHQNNSVSLSTYIQSQWFYYQIWAIIRLTERQPKVKVTAISRLLFHGAPNPFYQLDPPTLLSNNPNI